MARQARQKSKSGNYYIALKGEELFVTKADKERLLAIIDEKFEGGKVYGVEITKNEIRMAVKENEKGISAVMKSVTVAYARYFNRANDRDGKLFEGRFKSEPLESKKEVDDCVKNLKVSSPVKKSAPAKKTAPVKKVTPVKKTEDKTEVRQEEPKPKPQQKKNLPSWLL